MKKLIIANWKMNPTSHKEATNLFGAIKKASNRLKKTAAVICPPSVYIDRLAIRATNVCAVGGQDAFLESEGAYTGEVSPKMLYDLGADYVLLGHSERRVLGDTNDIVAKKVKKALDEKLKVVLCVGEKNRDEEGVYLRDLSEQLERSLQWAPKKLFGNITIAYEPVWAIGEKAKSPSTPEDFLEKSIYIRKIIKKIAGDQHARKIKILYGGSVDEDNADIFLQVGRADGLLVGRASLRPDGFNKILRLADI